MDMPYTPLYKLIRAVTRTQATWIDIYLCYLIALIRNGDDLG